jgi:hypothetical protein
MEVLAIAAGLLSMLVSLTVGIKLIRLSGRTHELPELFVGLSLVLMGAVWSALTAAGRQAQGLSDPVRVALILAGVLCAIAGTVTLLMFTYRVFRPGVAWARALAGAMVLALVALCLAQTNAPGWVVFAREEHGPWRSMLWIECATYVWSGLESWRHLQLLMRRQRIGLADPVVLDRIRLWTITMFLGVVASAMFGTLQILDIPVGGTTIGLGLTAVCTLSSSGTLLLAFVPPTAYVESVRRRAVAAA